MARVNPSYCCIVTSNMQEPGKISKKTEARSAEKPSEKSLGEILKQSAIKPPSHGVAVVLLIALALSALSILLMNHFDGATKMRLWIEGAGVWAPLAYIALKAATYIIAPLSGTPVVLAGGALFGFWDGAAYALVGDTIGASINFWLARLLRERGLVRIAGKKAIKQIDHLTDSVGGWKALVAARFFLSGLYDFIAYAAGLSKLSYKTFLLVTFFVGIPRTLLAVGVGNAAVTNQTFMYFLFGFSAIVLITVIFMQRKKPHDSK